MDDKQMQLEMAVAQAVEGLKMIRATCMDPARSIAQTTLDAMAATLEDPKVAAM